LLVLLEHGQSQLGHQGVHARLAVRPEPGRTEVEAASGGRENSSAQPIAGFEQLEFQAKAMQTVGGVDTRQTGANDGNLLCRHG